MDEFDAIADPLRRELLAALAVRPMRVVDLAAPQAVSRPAISRHLRLLMEAGLLEVEERGRERHYALRPDALGVVRDFLDRMVSAGVVRAVPLQQLDALDTEVRRTARERQRADIATAVAREDIA